ncbi:MAG: hypothetical protein ACFE9R_21700, partial [Candidatus Hermodarchaeota archaeon]
MLLPYIPFWFDIDGAMRAFGINQFHNEKNQLTYYGNESIGLHIELDISRTSFSDIDIVSGVEETTFGYMVHTFVSLIASKNIIPIGFSSKIQFHGVYLRTVEYDSEHYDPPVETLQFETGYKIKKSQICNSSGIVSYHFLMDLTVYNITDEYFITYLIPYDDLEYANFALIFYVFLC